MVAVEGPNTVGKVSMQGLEIPYDSFFTSKITLLSGATNKPILYGFLGNDVTYMMIKVNYNTGSSVRCCSGSSKENYIEYFTADDPNDVRPIGQLMILTGGSNHRIPQLYLNNPMDFNVTVEVMVASVDPVADGISTSVTEAILDGLYYNSLITDFFASGCTQFEIINEKDEILLVLPLDAFDINDLNIQNIRQDENILTVTTENNEKVILKFLTTYDANQAHSRFNWIFEDPTHRYLTKDYPEPDLIPPVITLNPYAGDIFNSSGITKDLLRIYYLESVVDNRDGIMNINDVDVVIRKHNSLVTLTAVTEEGMYDIIFRVRDIAENESTVLRNVIFDMTPPVITFKPAAQGNTISMVISRDSQEVPSHGLTQNDLIRYCIDNVVDNIDGVIANSAVTMQLTGTTFPITIGGIIPISFSVLDQAGNEALYTGKTLSVTNDIPPVLTQGLMFTIPTTGLTGGFESGYTLNLINDSGLTYGLQYSSGVTINKKLLNNFFPMYIIYSTISGYTSLYEYFNTTYNSGSTRDYLEEVANGNNPLFYIVNSNLIPTGGTYVTTGVTSGVTEYMIDSERYDVDGLYYDLQLRGDFPEGEYYMSGEISDIYGNINTMSFTINIRH
jgi:hypothetical protein